MFAGGIADKLGNRYESKWLVHQLLDVIGGQAEWLRYEGITSAYKGFEFAVGRGDLVEWHQTKVNAPNANWTIVALGREGVLDALRLRFEANNKDRCIFVSQDPAKDLRALAEKAVIAASPEEFQDTLGKQHLENLEKLLGLWARDVQTAFLWLKRTEIQVLPQAEIESYTNVISEVFFGTRDTFPILREFLDSRLNKTITTEVARAEIPSSSGLIFKNAALSLTSRQRVWEATSGYLDTYIPFGAGGSTIPRKECSQLVDLVADEQGPNVVLLTGAAGSGKSGAIREFIGRLRALETPHLAFRIDHHLDCSSPPTLGKAITGLEESPASTLKTISPDQRAVLIIDQVDAVSEVSGRSGAVRQAILRIVGDVRSLRTVVVVIGCRTFDLESDDQLKALKGNDKVQHIDVGLLSWADSVEPLLISKSINPTSLSTKQRELLCLPLNLSLFLETIDQPGHSFSSRNDLFTRLIEKKDRSIRTDRTPVWALMAPLSTLAEWMSDQQRLDAPRDTLAGFSGAADILSSEGLIVPSRSRINFFHESFFDYIYARAFAQSQRSLVSLLLASEQHLFRRTQVRQILETLRQIDQSRYLRELNGVLTAERVRFHIKVAVAQWLGSLSDPSQEEMEIVLRLDADAGSIPQLVRYALMGSAEWFDLLRSREWLTNNLNSNVAGRVDSILSWFSATAEQRPSDVAMILDTWWSGDENRGKALLNWLGYARVKKPNEALVDLCCRVIQARLPADLAQRQRGHRDLMLHIWLHGTVPGVSAILKAYFEAWYQAHPDQHPFERDEFRDFDVHALEDLAKTNPRALVEGSIAAFARAIDLLVATGKERHDFSFRTRSRTGHHIGADAFLNVFRSAFSEIAKSEPSAAEGLLHMLDPSKHEVLAHLWLETIAANGSALKNLLLEMLHVENIFNSGWTGAEWKSFADAVRETIEHMSPEQAACVEDRILSYWPELALARDVAARLIAGDLDNPWVNRETVKGCLSSSGYKQWCVLESVGGSRLSLAGRDRLSMLCRKFPKEKPPQPHHNEARWVGPPIRQESASHMSDSQWLKAMQRYDKDDIRRWAEDYTEGGARQLAEVLRHLVKQQPDRFYRLLLQIPNNVSSSYITSVCWGLTEAGELADECVQGAILNLHGRPNRPYGSEIARLLEKCPQLVADPAMFDVLVWYLEFGEADEGDDADESSAESEIVSIEDLMNRASSFHSRGINSVRGSAAEALGRALWHTPELMERAWSVFEQRAIKEPLISVRCCLLGAIVPLYNRDRERCATLAESLSSPHVGSAQPTSRDSYERLWLRLAMPSERRFELIKWSSVRLAGIVERFTHPRRLELGGAPRCLSPLLTHQGIYLLSFVLYGAKTPVGGSYVALSYGVTRHRGWWQHGTYFA